MEYKTICDNPIPYLKNEDNKVILDFSIDQHECDYYIQIWNALCRVIRDAEHMEAFPYGDTLFAIGVKLTEGKSYSVILTKYSLYVLGFADFNEGPEIPGGSKVIIFDIDAVAYPTTKYPKIDIRNADLLITQFQNMYNFWEQIKNNQFNDASSALRSGGNNGQSYFISFLVVVWFISEAAREETGRIAWLINLIHHGKITGGIDVSAEDGVVQAVRAAQDILSNCSGIFTWEANKIRVFTCWKQIANQNPSQNYITVQKIAANYNIQQWTNISDLLKKIFKDPQKNSL